MKYLTCDFDDLELGQFKDIEGQTSWCHSIAHMLSIGTMTFAFDFY